MRRLRAQREASRSVIDLTAVSWCDASGLVTIACLAENALRSGREVEVLAPSRLEVANYLSVMRLGHVLEELGAYHNLARVRDHHADTLLALHRFQGAAGAARLAEHTFDAVHGDSRKAAEALYVGLCEAGENVPEHSGMESGFVAAQRYPRDGRYFFAVGDSGRGMLATLASAQVTTDQAAIELALRQGGTGSGDVHRGNGLPEMLRTVGTLGGELLIASGNALVARRRRADSQRVITVAASLPGTILRGAVQTRRH